MSSIAIEDIWLMREGGESDPLARVVVYVRREGIWYEAIREHVNSSFSHCITANGLVSNECKPVDWLNKSDQSREKSGK